MIFSSFSFIFVYLPVTLAGFWATSRLDHRAAGLWLVLASLIFYGYWRIDFVPVLLTSIGFNYAIGLALGKAASQPWLQTGLLYFGILMNIAALFYFKYALSLAVSLGFVALNGQPLWDIALPLGISFFTFTQIGYLVDVKQGAAKTGNPLSYLLFVTFFPHLIAGPILHHREMVPQFADRKTFRFDLENLVVGLTIFVIGLSKKVILADPLAAAVGSSFAHPAALGFSASWYAAVAYSLQLYFDFSGYSDMAIGLARMVNVRFPLNFNSPYKATSIIDYWQRFHITLTRFITMYLFNPAALAIARWRERHGLDSSRRALTGPGGFASLVAGPTLMTMGLAGIWHGAGWNFLIFGVLHGLYITVNHAARVLFPPVKGPKAASSPHGPLVHCSKVLAVYVAALVAFVFFRATSPSDAVSLLAGMAGAHGLGESPSRTAYAQIVVLLLIVWTMPNTQQIMARYAPALGKLTTQGGLLRTWQPSAGWAIAAGGLAALGVLALSGTTEFLYFQF